MTDKKSRRVVIINNIKSDTIDQAIFILKSAKTDRGKNLEKSVAAEAQEIINNYIHQVDRIKAQTRKKRKSASVLPAALSLLSVLCIVLSVILFFNS